jgi:2-phosphoglycerate kinase
LASSCEYYHFDSATAHTREHWAQLLSQKLNQMMMTIDNIFSEIRKSWIDMKTRIIAIDGYGGSGKSMLADELILRKSITSLLAN